MKQPFINGCLGFQEAIITSPNKPSLKLAAPPSIKGFYFCLSEPMSAYFQEALTVSTSWMSQELSKWLVSGL